MRDISLQSAIRTLMMALTLMCGVANSHALIFYSSADPEKNTTAPTGSIANSGWQLEGFWGGFTGTPIGPHHFIAAAHVGGNIGQVFTFRGENYITLSQTKDPGSDLIIWEVAGTFPAYAPLFDGSSEVGSDVMVFGRGATRGDEVRVNGALKGWKWGTWDDRLRWGRNRITATINDQGQATGGLPHLLQANFDSNATADEATFAIGDSSGAIFILNNNIWKLAGINYGVDSPYNTSTSGAGFNAAIFDEGGLYQGGEGNWQFFSDFSSAQPGSFYATRIKARLAWIQGVLNSPLTPALYGANSIGGSFALVAGATFDVAAKTIRIPLSNATTFFKLSASSALTLGAGHLEGSTLVIQYF